MCFMESNNNFDRDLPSNFMAEQLANSRQAALNVLDLIRGRGTSPEFGPECEIPSSETRRSRAFPADEGRPLGPNLSRASQTQLGVD